MNHTIGSPLTLTTDRGTATFTNTEGTETWTQPLIGWATIVRWNGEPTHEDLGQQETQIEPVILLDDGTPTTVRSYCQYETAGQVSLVRIELDTQATP